MRYQRIIPQASPRIEGLKLGYFSRLRRGNDALAMIA
jgi:hypothetical protein